MLTAVPQNNRQEVMSSWSHMLAYRVIDTWFYYTKPIIIEILWTVLTILRIKIFHIIPLQAQIGAKQYQIGNVNFKLASIKTILALVNVQLALVTFKLAFENCTKNLLFIEYY